VKPKRYQIVVAGELGRRFAWAFDGMTMQCHDGQTDITGTVVDQAHLHGLLNRVGELGLDLVSVAPIDNAPDQDRRRDGGTAGRRTFQASR
jgi:hypothetical protein